MTKNQIMKFSPFPILQTNRLQLRQLEKNDSAEVKFLRSDELVNTYVKRPKTNTIEEAIHFINKINTGIEQGDWVFWGITIKGNPKLIGTICLWNFSEDKKNAEIGYDLHTSFHKKGIMNEALTCILDYGFTTLQLHTIEAYTHQNNEASKNLLIRNNFKLLPNKTDPDNVDNIIFSLHKLS